MKSLFILSMLIIFLVLILSCNKDEVTVRDYPRLKTLAVSNISENGANFNAEIIFRGTFVITSFGFVWSETVNPRIEKADKVVYTENINSQKFSSEISTALQKNVGYYVRAFITTKEYTVYGQNVRFLSKGCQSP
jgi:hypothetical protein